MIDFFKTHTVKHFTKEERATVREIAQFYMPTADYTYWGDRWDASDYPYMNYEHRFDEFNMNRDVPNIERDDRERVPKTVVSVQDFVKLFSIEQPEEVLDAEFLFELV